MIDAPLPPALAPTLFDALGETTSRLLMLISAIAAVAGCFCDDWRGA